MKSVPVDNIHYYTVPYREPQFVTVHAINIGSMANTDSETVVVEYSQNMYMSQDNIYITYMEQVNEWDIEQDIMKELLEPYVSEMDKLIVKKIEQTDSDILNNYEKRQKITEIYMSYLNYMSQEEQDALRDRAEEILQEKLEQFKHFEFTVVNKLAVDGGEVTVKENGKVPGNTINQFSMDEDEGFFRIATTLSQRWSRFGKQITESTNNVYVLDDDMVITGELEGLAPGESIFSTRFIGDRLYMVTFRQVDPFFVIDLSNPRAPKELGKLKIPGFSRYLHPYDEDTIIGIGQDASETGNTRGLKISLFDVSDVENPKEIAKYVTESRYAQSTALYEHKAFLFSKEKELLVIPAYSYDYGYDYMGGSRRGESYNGAFVFKITKDEIELRGLIDHSRAPGSAEYMYQPSVERSLYIEELLYTKSSTLLRINELEDLSSVKDVELTSTGSIKVY